VIFDPQRKLSRHTEYANYLNGAKVPMINIEVSLSSVCDAQCECCFYRNDQNKKEKFIQTSKFLLWMKEACNSGLKAITLSGGGEPTLHPDINEIILFLSIKTNLEVGMFTNALKNIKYRANFLKWIRITKTNRDFNEENIAEIRKQNKEVGLCINYQGSISDNDIKKALEIVYKYDLRYVQVRPALNLNGELTYVVAPTITDPKLIITQYKFTDCLKENRGYDKCEGYHFSPMIWEDGTMSVCMYMRHHPEYNIGSIYRRSFIDLCKCAPPNVAVLPDCQVCCKNNEINKMIHEARKVEDKNFV
jgi:hypothetical protein